MCRAIGGIIGDGARAGARGAELGRLPSTLETFFTKRFKGPEGVRRRRDGVELSRVAGERDLRFFASPPSGETELMSSELSVTAMLPWIWISVADDAAAANAMAEDALDRF